MLWERPWACRLSEALIKSHQFIGLWHGCHSRRSHVVSLYWQMHHLLLRFFCLHEAAILALLLRFFWPHFDRFLRIFLRLLFGNCSSGTPFSLWWSAMEYCRCQPPCSCFIASDDPHSKCVQFMGFSHAREAVFGNSKCKFSIFQKTGLALFSPSLTWACVRKFSGWIRTWISFIS